MGSRRVSTAAGRRVAVSVAGALTIAAGLFAVPAAAETIEVPIAETTAVGTPGTSVALGSAEVAEDLQGRSCEVSIVVKNQSSDHPGNVVVVTSGDSQIAVSAVEDVAFTTTTGGGTLTLGPTIDVSVTLGTDDRSSLGSNLSVTCEPLPETAPPPSVEGDPKYTG